MLGFDSLLGTYVLHARIMPAAIVLFPPFSACMAINVDHNPDPRRLTVFSVFMIASAFLLEQVVRDKGRRLQDSLWDSWGGPPVTCILRHRDTKNSLLLALRHKKLSTAVGTPMPTRRQERSNPHKADEVYEVAVHYLISRTRDPNIFPLVFTENRSYGFRRNMLGLRRAGFLLSFFTAFYLFAIQIIGNEARDPLIIATLAISLLSFLVWWKLVSPVWVKRSAERYAEQLFNAIDHPSVCTKYLENPGSVEGLSIEHA